MISLIKAGPQFPVSYIGKYVILNYIEKQHYQRIVHNIRSKKQPYVYCWVEDYMGRCYK